MPRLSQAGDQERPTSTASSSGEQLGDAQLEAGHGVAQIERLLLGVEVRVPAGASTISALGDPVPKEGRPPVVPCDEGAVSVRSELPGADLVSGGLLDLAAGRETERALLVAMARE